MWPGSEISFSQVREDPNIEITVLQEIYKKKQIPLDVFVIGSGGCTALSLLGEKCVASVDVVDANLAQIFLLRLRYQALQHLSLLEQRQLFFEGGGDREQIYLRLEPFLSLAEREYWQDHRAELLFGLNRVGKFEELFRELSKKCYESLGFLPLNSPKEAIAHKLWNSCFDFVFEREKLAETFGRAAVDYSMSKSFADHFSHVFAGALQKYPFGDNYFLQQVWQDEYGDNYPPYLQEDVQKEIRALETPIRDHQGFFLPTLEKLSSQQQWDLIQTSNISDWMPIEEMKQMFREVKRALKSGGAVVARRLNGDHVLEEIIAEIFVTDSKQNRRLLEDDSSFFYSEVVIGWKG